MKLPLREPRNELAPASLLPGPDTPLMPLALGRTLIAEGLATSCHALDGLDATSGHARDAHDAHADGLAATRGPARSAEADGLPPAADTRQAAVVPHHADGTTSEAAATREMVE